MKTIAFIDAGMLRPTIVESRLNVRMPGRRLDWEKFVCWMRELANGNLFDIHYYDAIPDEPSPGLNNYHLFLRTKLQFQLHFSPLRTKRKQCPFCEKHFHLDEQKGVDVAIARHLIKLAPHYEQALLISGDEDFESTVTELRSDFGRRVKIVGWQNGIAPSLRIVANEVVHLDDSACQFMSPNPNNNDFSVN